MTAGRIFAASIVWLAFGAAGLLSLTGAAPRAAGALGEIALVLPAIPMYFVATRFETARSNAGVLWASVHGPPFLTPPGLIVVYVLPALVTGIWMVVRRRRTLRS